MKYEVGEVCLGIHPDGIWREVTIIEVGKFQNANGSVSTYCLDAPNHPMAGVVAGITADDHELRKLRPPQTDTDDAAERFIKELKGMIFKDEVKA